MSKSFGGTRALRSVDLDMRRGEVHALVGGNGSGKSTLIKILAGVYHADAGSLRIKDRDLELSDHTPDQARAVGMRFVHQDLGIFPSLTVGENLSIGRGFELAPGHRISWRRNRARAESVLQRFGVQADPRQLASTLSVPQRAMLAIARALQDTDEDGVLVLDEPTAALPPSEVRVLTTAIGRLTETGRSVLLVTHRLDEVRHLANRVTALRDGRQVGTIGAADMTERDLVTLIVGAQVLSSSAPRSSVLAERPVLEVGDASAGPLSGIDLVVHPGEVVGVAGILGSGRTELLRMIYGTMKLSAGTVRIGGRVVSPSPAKMRSLGVAFVPEDRQAEAIFSDRTVRENMTEGRLGSYFKRLWLRDGRIRRDVERDVKRFSVKTPSTLTPIDNLSGGNQQKVVLARCLREEPTLLLLDEPTQGIDVAAREEIFELVNQAAGRGCAVVVVSSEFEELIRLSHRVIVLARGRVVAEHAAPVDAHVLLESAMKSGAST
ncbi:MAG TPA: sugar ABC transporter ATP-binding protein [Jatrophihabitantaceae bacterium]